MSIIDRHADLIAALAGELDVEVRTLAALIEVEAAGEGLSEGRPIIRLEVHKLWLDVPKPARAKVDARFRVLGPRPWEGHRFLSGDRWVELHRPGRAGQDREWEALDVAKGIDEEAAIGATSWGAGQLLGEHWRALGYDSSAAFVDAQHDEGEQLRAMARFLEAIADAGAALKDKDWREVARRYNGPGQVAWYAARLEAAYERRA